MISLQSIEQLLIYFNLDQFTKWMGKVYVYVNMDVPLKIDQQSKYKHVNNIYIYIYEYKLLTLKTITQD